MAVSKKSLVAVFLVGIVLTIVLRIVQVRLTTPSFKAQRSDFKLQPPTQALQGTFFDLKGEVRKTSAKDKKTYIVKRIDKIMQGESITTNATSSAVVALPDRAEITIHKNAQLDFPTLLKGTLLLKQNSGEVQYDVTSPDGLSVRVLHSLLQMSDGSITVIIDEDGSQVTVESRLGEVTIGMVDEDNNTQITSVEEGKTAIILDQERSVEIQ